MLDVNIHILDALEQSRNKLSDEAVVHIKKYLNSRLHVDGGFVDRAGNQDPYYSVFGYTLAFVFDLQIDSKIQFSFLDKWRSNHKIDFVHAVSLLRSSLLVHAIRYKSKNALLTKKLTQSDFFRTKIRKKIVKEVIKKNTDLLSIIDSHCTKEKGFNHNFEKAEKSTIYATFLAWTLFQDMGVLKDDNAMLKSIYDLKAPDAYFVNEYGSTAGVTTTTSAGLIMTLDQKDKNTIAWLKNMWINHGGFAATDGIEIADLLSTSTALLALKMAGESLHVYADKCSEFISLHWDSSGGFFGSVADTQPDCEYTYYGLLALGLL